MGGRIFKDQGLFTRKGRFQQYLDQIKNNYPEDINASCEKPNAEDINGVGTITIACSSADAEDHVEEVLKKVENTPFSGSLQSSTFRWSKEGSADESNNETSIYTIKSGDSSFMLMLYLEAEKNEKEKKLEKSSGYRP